MLQRLKSTDPGIGDAASENVLPALAHWLDRGKAAALVTLVGVDGASPRALGAQIAVSASGETVGSLSSGCLEAAIRREAVEAIAMGQNRLLRYGKGSPFIDLVLPCGSGFEVHVAPMAERSWLDEALILQRRRIAFAVNCHLPTGRFTIAPHARPSDIEPTRRIDRDGFARLHAPPARLVLVGEGAAAGVLAGLAELLDLDVALADDIAGLTALDAWSAAVLLLHDHEHETPFLGAALASDCFYVGAVGSHRTHAARLAALASLGFTSEQLARVRGPIGLIERAKTPRELAVSVLAEILDAARANPRFGA